MKAVVFYVKSIILKYSVIWVRFFDEYNSYNWEMKIGNLSIKNSFDTTYSKHGPNCYAGDMFVGYTQNAIDIVKKNLSNLDRGWLQFYNNLKK